MTISKHFQYRWVYVYIYLYILLNIYKIYVCIVCIYFNPIYTYIYIYTYRSKVYKVYTSYVLKRHTMKIPSL